MRRCIICDKEFLPKISIQECCTPECWEVSLERQKARAKEIRDARVMNKACFICRKKLPGVKINQKYCSKDCAKIAKARDQSWSFIIPEKIYNPDWKAIKKEIENNR